MATDRRVRFRGVEVPRSDRRRRYRAVLDPEPFEPVTEPEPEPEQGAEPAEMGEDEAPASRRPRAPKKGLTDG